MTLQKIMSPLIATLAITMMTTTPAAAYEYREDPAIRGLVNTREVIAEIYWSDTGGFSAVLPANFDFGGPNVLLKSVPCTQ